MEEEEEEEMESWTGVGVLLKRKDKWAMDSL